MGAWSHNVGLDDSSERWSNRRGAIANAHNAIGIGRNIVCQIILVYASDDIAHGDDVGKAGGRNDTGCFARQVTTGIKGGIVVDGHIDIGNDLHLGFLAFHHENESAIEVEIFRVDETELEGIDGVALRHLCLIVVDGLRDCGQILGVEGQ